MIKRTPTFDMTASFPHDGEGERDWSPARTGGATSQLAGHPNWCGFPIIYFVGVLAILFYLIIFIHFHQEHEFIY